MTIQLNANMKEKTTKAKQTFLMIGAAITWFALLLFIAIAKAISTRKAIFEKTFCIILI